MSSVLSVGLLPYTLIPKTDTKCASIAFLLWRDKRTSPIESSVYWSHIVTPKAKEDSSALDTVCRGFAMKTKGLFAPLATDKLVMSQADLQQESRNRLREKLAKAQGTVLLSHGGHLIYVAPVRFI